MTEEKAGFVGDVGVSFTAATEAEADDKVGKLMEMFHREVCENPDEHSHGECQGGFSAVGTYYPASREWEDPKVTRLRTFAWIDELSSDNLAAFLVELGGATEDDYLVSRPGANHTKRVLTIWLWLTDQLATIPDFLETPEAKARIQAAIADEIPEGDVRLSVLRYIAGGNYVLPEMSLEESKVYALEELRKLGVSTDEV